MNYAACLTRCMSTLNHRVPPQTRGLFTRSEAFTAARDSVQIGRPHFFRRKCRYIILSYGGWLQRPKIVDIFTRLRMRQ